MKYAIALVAAAGIAASANAQNTKLIFEASVNGGPWTMNLAEANPGDVVKIRLSAALINYNGTRSILGFSGITLQPTLSGWNAGSGDTVAGFDAFSDTRAGGGVAAGGNGRQFPFNTGAPMTTSSPSGEATTFVDGGNTLRWSGALNTAGGSTLTRGLGLAQQTQGLLGGDFSTSTNPVLFVYQVTIGASRAGAADGSEFLTASAPLNLINLARGSWYTAANGLNTVNAAVTTDTIMPVRINIVPTPGALALLGLGGLVAGRRRR